MSDKYAALKRAAEKATWGDWTAYQPHKGARGHEVKVGIKAVAQHCLKNDAGYIALAGPKVVLELLAERDADKRRISELEEMADLQRDKIKRLESDLWDEQQLRKVHSQKSFELESENRELKQRNDKDFVWRGEEIGRLNDEIDALKEKWAEAGISLKIEGE